MKTNNDILNELKAVSPLLANIRKLETGDVPALYFEMFNERLLGRIRQEEVAAELEAVAPVLSSLSKPGLMNIPATYFAELPAKTWKAVLRDEKRKSIQRPSLFGEKLDELLSILFKPKYALAFATVFSAVLLSGVFFSSRENSTEKSVAAQINQLTETDIQNYLADNNDELDEHLLLKNADFREAGKTIKQNELSNKEIEDYIAETTSENI